MDTRYTNRDRFLDGLNNIKLAELICRDIIRCRECPITIKNDGDYHDCLNGKENCVTKISKWLGEYSDD